MPRHRWDHEAPLVRNLRLPCDRHRAAAGTGDGRSRPGRRQWRQSSHGLWVPTTAPDVVEQRILEHGARLRPGQAVTGWAALRLLGAGLFDGLGHDGRTRVPVPLAVGPRGRIRQSRHVRVFQDRLPDSDRLWCAGIWVTTVERACFDAMRMAGGLRAAVAVLDTVIGAGLVLPSEMENWLGARAGWNGIRLARAALPLARPGVRSPQETRLRLTCELDIGISGLLVNHTVIGPAGERIGEVDLLDPHCGLALEFDGADHRTAERHTHDIAKQSALEQLRIVVARFTSRDIGKTALVHERIRSCRSRALETPPALRTWSTEPPARRHNATLAFRLREAARR